MITDLNMQYGAMGTRAVSLLNNLYLKRNSIALTF